MLQQMFTKKLITEHNPVREDKKENSMTRLPILRSMLALLVALTALAPTVAQAALTPPPLPLSTGQRFNPQPIPLPSFDLIVNAPLTANALEADAWDGGRRQEAEGRGVRQTETGYGAGLTLYDSPNVCVNFNAEDGWSSSDGNPDMYTDWFSGWGPFALNEGEYKASNVAVTRERSVGPGDRYNDTEDTDNRTEYAIKFASHLPYAAGMGSPRIPVPAGFAKGKVMVSVRYLIWDHDQGAKDKIGDGIDYDWASLGIKPGADGEVALYNNGYVRGEWSELAHTVELGDAKDIMVLIQAQSPAYLNSNIYFDDIKIAFIAADGTVRYLQDCGAVEALK
jgi:hypothetical protein